MWIVLIGPPGAGKGTQCARLVDYVGIPHISTGDIFRQAASDDTELGKKAARYMEQGLLVPDDLVVEMVNRRIKQPDCRNGCLLDGFPRTLEQTRALDELLDRRGASLDIVLLLDVPHEELQRRMLERARLENRADDRPEAISRRLQVYRAQTTPLVQYYSQRGVLERVDGMGSPDEVFQRLRQCIDDRRSRGR